MNDLDDWFSGLVGNEPFEIPCDTCGTTVTTYAGAGAKLVSHAIERKCDYGNCIVDCCPKCNADQGRCSVTMAGWPDCPCENPTYCFPGRIVWPFTSKVVTLTAVRFLSRMLGKRYWPNRLLPYTQALELFARASNPEYFQKTSP